MRGRDSMRRIRQRIPQPEGPKCLSPDVIQSPNLPQLGNVMTPGEHVTGQLLNAPPQEAQDVKTGTRPPSRWRWLIAIPLLSSAGLLAAAALHQPADPPTLARTFTSGDPLCEITDKRLSSISGMVATADGIWVVNDTAPVLYLLDSACKVTKVVDLTDKLAAQKITLTDIEDLVQGTDGWLWLADTGGNRQARNSVQLVGYRDSDTKPRVVTLDYPSGSHDTEAVAIDLMGRAVLVTKVTGGKPAEVFRTRLPLRDDATQEIRKIGEVSLDQAKSGQGTRTITGAAVAPSGTYITLRTYVNAWEFSAPDGDLASALVEARPRRVELPRTTQGEAITYTPDGGELLTTGEEVPVPIDRVVIDRTVQ